MSLKRTVLGLIVLYLIAVIAVFGLQLLAIKNPKIAQWLYAVDPAKVVLWKNGSFLPWSVLSDDVTFERQGFVSDVKITDLADVDVFIVLLENITTQDNLDALTSSGLISQTQIVNFLDANTSTMLTKSTAVTTKFSVFPIQSNSRTILVADVALMANDYRIECVLPLLYDMVFNVQEGQFKQDCRLPNG